MRSRCAAARPACRSGLARSKAPNASEGDDVSLRVFVGQSVASVSATASSDPTALAERAVAMAKVSPEDPYQGLADPALLAKTVRDLDLFDPTVVSADELKESALAAEEAALAVTGVTNSSGSGASAGLGGLVLATSHGFVGQYVASRFGRSASVIAGEGTGMERDYDYSSQLHYADLDAPEDDRPQGRRAGGAPPQCAQGQDRPGGCRLRSARRARHCRPSRRRDQRRLRGAQDQLPARHDGQAGGLGRDHRHRRTAAARAARRRVPSTARASRARSC